MTLKRLYLLANKLLINKLVLLYQGSIRSLHLKTVLKTKIIFEK